MVRAQGFTLGEPNHDRPSMSLCEALQGCWTVSVHNSVQIDLHKGTGLCTWSSVFVGHEKSMFIREPCSHRDNHVIGDTSSSSQNHIVA